MRGPAVLFARGDSVYKELPGVDVYDVERDALTWPGGAPLVAHPPCRLWCRMRGFSTAPASEKALAVWAVDMVRTWGGVLEHPSGSLLWAHCGLPRPGGRLSPVVDAFGGWSLAVSQKWWGHRAEKSTWLYLVGVAPRDLPEMPFSICEATHSLGLWARNRRSPARRPVSKRERDATPRDFAQWLLEVVRRVSLDGVAA